MRVTPSKLSSEFVLALLAALLLFAPSSGTYAQSTTRSFQMGVWDSITDYTDIPTFSLDRNQPAGRSILFGWNWYSAPIAAGGEVDWSHLVAVLIDEPYRDLDLDRWVVGHPHPCTSQEAFNAWLAEINAFDARLAQRAAELRSVAPRARFWVNFTEAEASWMVVGLCGEGMPVERSTVDLNKPYIDVISVDRYEVDFDANLKPYYGWWSANPAKPDQQMALIAGTFYRAGQPANQPGGVLQQASLLQHYFDYADTMNHSCDLPLGSRGRTGTFDGCPVWIVLGWQAEDSSQGGTTYVGLRNSNAAPIATAWETQRAKLLRRDLAYQLTKVKIVPLLLPMLVK